MTSLLELRRIGKRFADGTQALRDVSLAVPAGQFCVLLGASGAGKSTLLGVINGLIPPCSGTVSIAGTDCRPGRRRQRRVATIHQGVDLVPRLSVLNNVLCGALAQVSLARAMSGFFGASRQRRACELLDRVGLSEAHLYRRASELSGGQQQRVGIARAFMSVPALVLADEPVASLDPQTGHDILSLLHEASRERAATVLCSLHQVDLATEFADRVVGMRGGIIIFDCEPRDLSPTMLRDVYGKTVSRDS